MNRVQITVKRNQMLTNTKKTRTLTMFTIYIMKSNPSSLGASPMFRSDPAAPPAPVELGPDGQPLPPRKPMPKIGPDGKPVIGPDGKMVMEYGQKLLSC